MNSSSPQSGRVRWLIAQTHVPAIPRAVDQSAPPVSSCDLSMVTFDTRQTIVPSNWHQPIKSGQDRELLAVVPVIVFNFGHPENVDVIVRQRRFYYARFENAAEDSSTTDRVAQYREVNYIWICARSSCKSDGNFIEFRDGRKFEGERAFKSTKPAQMVCTVVLADTKYDKS